MNASDIARLEQLSRLKESGALSEEEFADAKSKLLRGGPAPRADGVRPEPEPTAVPPVSGTVALSPIWKFRFDFMKQHGLPSSPAFSKACRDIAFWKRSRLAYSLLALFFGPIYFLILGLWRPTVTLMCGSLVYGAVLVELDLSDGASQAAGFAYGGLYGVTCVPLYYLKVTRGIHRWNPFFWYGAEWRKSPPAG